MKQLRKIFNIVSAAVLLTSFYPLLFWNRLEGVRIPTRFGLDGTPDRWGNMTSLLILCVIATAAYVFFLACQRAPQLMNTLEPEPAKITPGVSSAVKDFISHLCLVCMLLHSSISNSGLAVALGKAQAMPSWIYAVLLALIVIAAVVLIVRVIVAVAAQRRG